jgi:hypothetical protein
MSKTQLLSDTKNLLYFRIKSLIMKQEQVITWYRNDGTLPPKNAKQEVLSILHFWETPNTCLQYSI